MQPAGLSVPPWQVRFAEPATVHWPVQVMLQVPAPQFTEEPTPTVCVQDLPLHATWQLAPHEPVQVASPLQLKLQL